MTGVTPPPSAARSCHPEAPAIDYPPMTLLTTLLAVIGAGLILAALTFVTLLIGVLITSMVALFCGPIVDRLLGEDAAGASS